jgi:hypothetical protein
VERLPDGKRATVKPVESSHKVAVIAVHGVAYHKPCASAAAMADLLLSLPAKNPGDGTEKLYTSFTARTIYIPLRPVRVPEPSPLTPRSAFSFLQEQSSRLAAGLAETPTRIGRVSNQFTRALLNDYKGGAEGNTYKTERLQGSRADGKAEVHVYEAYWADLARPNNSIRSFFMALFQLLLHMGSLSRLAIDTGAAESAGSSGPRQVLWKWFRLSHGYAVRMLQLPIPILNVILLIAAFSILPLQVAGDHCPTWLPIVGGSVIGAAAGFFPSTRWLPVPRAPWQWAALPAALAAGSAMLVSLVVPHCVHPLFAAALEWWAIGFIPLAYVLDS